LLSSPLAKNIPLYRLLKSLLSPAPSCTRQRGVRVVTDVGCRMRWTRRHARRSVLESRTAKPCGPDAPTLASSWRRCRRITQVMSPAHRVDDGGNKARSPGRARSKPLKPLRRGGRIDPTTPVATTLVCFLPCTRGRGCGGHPAFPAPSIFEGQEIHASLGRAAPRECRRVSLPDIAVRRTTSLPLAYARQSVA
jgi:hypothetical protein